MHTDPVADLLTRVRNGSRSRLEKVTVPYSKFKAEVARVLKSEGFVNDVQEVPGKIVGQGTLDIVLRYDERNEPVLGGIRRVSKPGMRRYMSASELPKVRSGLGILILTTSRGVMSDRDARKHRLGGEAICTVW